MPALACQVGLITIFFQALALRPTFGFELGIFLPQPPPSALCWQHMHAVLHSTVINAKLLKLALDLPLFSNKLYI